MRVRMLVALLGAALVLGACGGSDDGGGVLGDQLAEEIIEQAAEEDVDVDIDTGDDGELTLTFDEGDEQGEMSFGGDLPDDFPFPVPDDYEVGTSLEIDQPDGKAWSAVISVDDDEFDDVADMYISWLEGEGFEVTTNRMEGDTGKFVIIGASRTDARADITMSIEEVSNEVSETVVSLTWTSLSG